MAFFQEHPNIAALEVDRMHEFIILSRGLNKVETTNTSDTPIKHAYLLS